jgi:hypothetical protein
LRGGAPGPGGAGAAPAAGCDGLFPQPDNASKAISGVRPRSEWKIGV